MLGITATVLVSIIGVYYLLVKTSVNWFGQCLCKMFYLLLMGKKCLRQLSRVSGLRFRVFIERLYLLYY